MTTNVQATTPATADDIATRVWSVLMDYCKATRQAPADRNDLFELVQQIRALPQAAIPEGYALVPIEPNKAMFEAGAQANGVCATYRAMVAAAKASQA